MKVSEIPTNNKLPPFLNQLLLLIGKPRPLTTFLLLPILTLLLNLPVPVYSLSSPPCYIKQLLRTKTSCPCSTETYDSFQFSYDDMGGASQLSGINEYTVSFWFKFTNDLDVESYLFALISDPANRNVIDNSFWLSQIANQQYFKIDAIIQEQFVHTWSGSRNKWIFAAISQRFSAKSIGVYFYEFEGLNQLRNLNQNLTASPQFPSSIAATSKIFMCSLAYPDYSRGSWCGLIHDFKLMTHLYFIEIPIQFQDMIIHAGPQGKVLVNYRLNKFNENYKWFDYSFNEMHILSGNV